MRTRRPSFQLVVCLLLGLASASPGRAQSSEAPKPAVLPPVSVEVVRIDVVVTDKARRHRAGLVREDFAVFEDGVPQTLVQFEAFTRWTVAKPSAPAPPPSAPSVAAEAPRPLPRRFVVLVIDDIHMGSGNMVRVQKALTRFIDEDMGAEDQVGLLTTSGAQSVSQELTSDRELLRRTISRLTAKDRRAEWLGVPHITEYQAELIERGDPEALEAAVQEMRYDGMVGGLEEMARQKARAIFTDAVYQSRLTLETLDRLTRGLARLSGRKVVFLLSDGFLTGLSAYSGAGFDIRRVIDAGTRAGVVIYSLETRGLTAIPGWSAAIRVRAIPQTFPLVFSMQRQSEEATRNAMHALAADTGGFLVDNSNDLKAGLKQMLEDTETYYVLAYEPTNTKRDGAFRKIEVRLPGQRDLKLRARAGYFAPDDRRAGAPAAMPPEAARQAERPRSGASAAPGPPAPPTASPVHLSADFVSLESGVTEVVVSGHLEATSLPFVKRRERYQATVDIAAAVFDANGAVVATLATDSASLDLTEAAHERVLRGGLVYQKTAALKPGRYLVRLSARAGAAGPLGGAEQWVEIPDLATARLTLSSAFLLRASEAPSASQGNAEGGLALRNAQALPHYRRDENLYWQLYVYNPTRDASGASSLVAQAEILRGGVVVGTGAPEPMPLGELQGPPVPHTSRIALHSFEPGEYELRVSVTDRNANQVATRQVGFTVE